MGFVHLRVHSEYSLENGLVRLERKGEKSPLMRAVKEGGMSAVALTDLGNLFAAVRFYRAAIAVGVKPIFGVEVRLQHSQEKRESSRMVLLAQSETGFHNIKKLVSRSYLEGQVQGVAHLQRAWFDGHCDGVIALCGGRSGEIGRHLLAGDQEQAERALRYWSEAFPGRFYLEVQRTHRPGDEHWLHGAVALAEKTGLPVVATNDALFLTPEEFEAHEARVAIYSGRVLADPQRPRDYSVEQSLKSAVEMEALFADLPEALENSVEIARRCNVELALGKSYLPEFPTPGGMGVEKYFRQQSAAGLEQRLLQRFGSAVEVDHHRAPYDERLQIELDVICNMDFPGYFLIVADFIGWSRKQKIPVGPGRGSGAGSLVAYSLGITDLDPLQYELLFERFLNPERVSMPDFDIDFCMDRRDEVIQYVAETYGLDRVSQIITYGRMNAKAVVRDVGRVLGHPYGMVDRIAKLIPFDLKMTLEKALQESDELRQRYEDEEDVHDLIDLARALEGLARNAGKHAGGVVISPSDINDFSPIYCESNGAGLVTQFDKDDVEAVGLVKFDFLGLRTLTIIDWALGMINPTRTALGEPPLLIEEIDLQDAATFELLRNCQTTAVFQLESTGMKELIGKLKPDCFEDIIALVALYRPGPIESGMVDNFINRKHGLEEVSYPDPEYQHALLQPILQPTYGVILYQEQVMQIAQVLAGYSLGGADLLRRAMGKKKPEEMEKQRVTFGEGAAAAGIDPKLAMKIFDLVEKFAGYGFNKSHSAAYALVSYQTAWLKAHYPAQFMAAVLSADMDNTDKVVTLIEECRSLQLRIHPPGINHSHYRFTVVESEEGRNHDVVYGLGAIKGVGESAIEGIIVEREQNGPYLDLFDCCRRIDLRRVNRRVLESLIRAGAFDEIAPVLDGRPRYDSRATLMESLGDAVLAAEQHSRDLEQGQGDLFGALESASESQEHAVHAVRYRLTPPWREDLRLMGEREILGLYLTGHPIDQYEPELCHFVNQRLNGLIADRSRMVTITGQLISLRVVRTGSGRQMAILLLDDRTGRFETTLFDAEYERYRELLEADTILVLQGVVTENHHNGGLRLKIEQLWNLDGARATFMRRLRLRLQQSQLVGEHGVRFRQWLRSHCEGNCPIRVDYRGDGVEAAVDLGPEWQILPDKGILEQLRERLGEEAVVPEYVSGVV